MSATPPVNGSPPSFIKKSLKVLTHPFVSYLIKRLFDRIKRTFIATVAAQFFGKAAEKASPFMMARTQEPSPIAQFSHQVQYVINLLANREVFKRL